MTDECERQLALARRQLEATQQISAALYSVTDLNALQRLALQTAMDVVEADAGSLLLHDPERNTLVFRHVTGPVADALIGTSMDLSLGLGIAGQVFRTGQARLSNDVEQDADHVGTVDARTGYHTHSLMTVPLRRRGEPPLGVVQLVNKRTGAFDAGDMAVIEVMGSLVVMALQNASLAEETKLAAIARSVGEISHDIGNMLTSVLPYVQTLGTFIDDVRTGQSEALPRLEEMYGMALEATTDGVKRIQSRTREISRAVKGEVAPMEFAPGQPFTIARRVVLDLLPSAREQGVLLSAEGDESLEAVFDEQRLYNAVYNLVSNALPETPAGGRVTVTTAPDSDADFYTIVVSDTGAGMSEKTRAEMFTDAIRSTKPGGTGLGTRIVRRIVEQHGGTPSVASTPGEGTTITLRLPKIPPQS